MFDEESGREEREGGRSALTGYAFRNSLFIPFPSFASSCSPLHPASILSLLPHQPENLPPPRRAHRRGSCPHSESKPLSLPPCVPVTAGGGRWRKGAGEGKEGVPRAFLLAILVAVEAACVSCVRRHRPGHYHDLAGPSRYPGTAGRDLPSPSTSHSLTHGGLCFFSRIYLYSTRISSRRWTQDSSPSLTTSFPRPLPCHTGS